MTGTTIDAVITRARARGLDRLDAQLLVAHAFGRTRAWVLAHGDEALPADRAAAIEAWVDRRAAGEPLAYLTGEKEFHGLTFAVDARVLVPRPDSETLVDWALDLLRDAGMGWPARPAVVDLGTGSGALAAAVASGCPAAVVVATDRSQDALSVAAGNFQRLGLVVETVASDWWSALAGRRFDLAITNPPYVAEGDPHLAALAHEPLSALAAGPDGLADIRRIAASAPQFLHAPGWLLIEHGHDQADAVQRLLADAGFDAVQTRRDLGSNARCSGGRRPG